MKPGIIVEYDPSTGKGIIAFADLWGREMYSPDVAFDHKIVLPMQRAALRRGARFNFIMEKHADRSLHAKTMVMA